jgi:K+-sensing histidine kinase KdpD
MPYEVDLRARHAPALTDSSGRRAVGLRPRKGHRLSTWWTKVFTFGIGAPRATLAGVAMVAVLAVVLGPPQHQVTRAAQALTLVVPVVGAAVLGGRHAAYAVGAAATVAFSLLVPPVGTLRVLLTQDLVALVVFSVVAVVVGRVVALRIELLGAVERERSALLRSVSHDLRTPLSAIRAAASDLADNDRLAPETARRFAEVIGEESERLDRLVANLLSLSRIEAGAYAPVRQAVDIGELIDSTTARLGRLLTALDLRLDVADDLPFVHGDYTQLDQLVTNLLENAARHTPAGGSVTVEARRGDGEVVLVVADDGPGVDPAEVATLFQPFRSGRNPGASGIGLAICKAVVDGHHGTIDVGAAPGGGAAFTVRLPVG